MQDFRGEEVAIIGYAARLPGADNVREVWNSLVNGDCHVSRIPESRWSAKRFYDPDREALGKTYAHSAGLLNNVYDFDASHFGLTPREAAQMDPQQRLLLETAAHALDDAGIDPSRLDRERTGVFVGAASSDHSTTGLKDPSMIDAHYMLGNTLSIISNRISYQWDLKGPSYTVDTACSSGLFAFDHAFRAIAGGEIDTAIVGSVNMLLSPIPFVGFSRASMLSPTGLCHAFGKDADGYVRAEGAVVFILRRADLARSLNDKLRSIIVGTGTNSDGRTNGIAMPSSARQLALLKSIKSRFDFSPEDLAFIEAHGTGTPVGDPEEARAIGVAYGQERSAPLLIGSAKTNFGHLEPAAGLVGLLKAQLALENQSLPPSLHAEELNPNIPFEELGLALAREAVVLPERSKPWLAAVNSFGFGGANAHAVIRQVKQPPHAPRMIPSALLLTATSEAALKALAQNWRYRTKEGEAELADAVADANLRLTRHPKRLALAAGSAEQLRTYLDEWLSGNRGTLWTTGTARVDGAKLGFVFSGNGSQWAGMGRSMLLRDPVFRASFEDSSAIAIELGSASLLDLLMSPELEEQLGRAPVGQPLLLSVQIATVDALAARGVLPDAVLGHSAGEVAAAYASRSISRRDALRVIIARSSTLDRLYGRGTMAALSCDWAHAEKFISSAKLDVCIAAENSPSSITVSGTEPDIVQLLKICRRERIAGKMLAIEYPYHSRQIEALRRELVDELEGISGRRSKVPMVSGAAGERIAGEELDAAFWWKNARDPVRFRSGIEKMAELGVSVFLEISPKSVLQSYIKDTLEAGSLGGVVLGSLEQTEATDIDAFTISLNLLAHGVSIDDDELLGKPGAFKGALPIYPFDRKTYSLHSDHELDLWGTALHHELLGARVDPDADIWSSDLTLGRVPWLADHKVNGRVLLPATAIVEIFLAAARDLSGSDTLELRHLDILRAVQLTEGRAVSARVIYERSARRLSLEVLHGGTWNWMAGATVFKPGSQPPRGVVKIKGDQTHDPHLYSELRARGLDYGPAFARLESFVLDETAMDVRLGPAKIDINGFVLDPTATDAVLHGLLPLAFPTRSWDEALLVPSHIGQIRFHGSGIPSGASVTLRSGDTTGLCADVRFTDADGHVVAEFLTLWLRPMPTASGPRQRLWNEREVPISQGPERDWRPDPKFSQASGAVPADFEVVRNAIGMRFAWNVVNAPEGNHSDRRVDEACAVLNSIEPPSTGLGNGVQVGSSPWPEIADLIALLVEIKPTAVDDLDATLHGATSDRLNDAPGFSRLSTQILDYLRTAPLDGARILLVGHADPTVVQTLVERAGHVVVAVDNADAVDVLRFSLTCADRIAIAPFEETMSLPPFDVTIAVAAALTLTSPMQRKLARHAAQGNPTLLFDHAADAFEVMTGRYATDDAVNALDQHFERLDLPSDRLSCALDPGIIFAFVKPPQSAPRDLSSVQILGTSCFADRLRAISAVSNARSSTVAIAFASGTDLMSTIADQSKAFRTLPETAEVIWIVQEGVQGHDALKGWRRVLKNELRRDIRIMNVGEDVDLSMVVQTLLTTRETELVMTEAGARSSRIVADSIRTRTIGADERLVLRQVRADNLIWKADKRRAPAEDEIEIEVGATALNFRDVMFARGLLPPEILADGFAGPTLGMECSGIVTRTGPRSGYNEGDRVIAFSPSAFATHLTVSARAASLAPEALDFPAAAAIPVIFLTAEYSLAELSRIQPGEWCLIHGGAGGVGLAAIQVARRAGAMIIATAGSEKKRAYLKFLGVDHVCDSRTLDFVDEVASVTVGKGVDVVLNSLAGEAMEKGIACLSPFGRFIELGKRDFVANTAVGLRALRKNITYFGVDVDQLLNHRPALVDKLIKSIVEGFEGGYYTVPPVKVFSAEAVMDAYRLMEGSGHIGKVVVRPPIFTVIDKAAQARFDGAWMIAGGTRGFGLETAKALAADGAEELWLVSRSGTVDQQDFAEDMHRRGVKVHVRAVDLADHDAVHALFDEIENAGRGLVGIVCGAAHFDDALFAELDEERIGKVLRAKLATALAIDHASRRFNLKHFWLYSSVASRFGNPGQSSYVVANLELEALARRRVQQGLPALAIAWGPISDAGNLSGAGDLAQVIERKLGSMMSAKTALGELFQVLRDGFDKPTITISPVDWSLLKSDLPTISEPLFEYLDIRESDQDQDGVFDVLAHVAEKGETKTRRVLLDIICREAAQIMRIAPAEIDVDCDLTDLGFDSLMGMRLKLAVEERLGMATPISSVGEGLTLSRLASRIVTSALSEARTDEADVMAERHLAGTEMPKDLKDEIANAASR